MENFANGPEMPIGLGMAFAQNAAAMARFSSLTPEERRSVIERTHGISSAEEMRSFVDSMLWDPWPQE